MATGETFTVACRDKLSLLPRLPNFGSKMGVDATRKWPEEGFTREWPEVIDMDPAVKNKVDMIWQRLGLDNDRT